MMRDEMKGKQPRAHIGNRVVDPLSKTRFAAKKAG